MLNSERRETDRRSWVRRQNPSDDPGPPGRERRQVDRRQLQRRRDLNASQYQHGSGGWQG
jgi:hypothetical protein